MKRNLVMALCACGLMASASAQAATFSATYGWEDGAGTILGSYGNLVNPANVTTGDEISNSLVITAGVTPNSGSQMLTVSESPHASTPQAYVAYIENLNAGDVVDASFFGWDSTAAASPSLRIWGHYADNGDVTSYAGSAGGNDTYTDGSGWSSVGYSYVMPSAGALVIEARLYSSPSTADPALSSYFIDDMTIEVTTESSTAQITTPGGTTVIPEPASLALMGLGALVTFKRR